MTDTKAYTLTNPDKFCGHLTLRYVDPDNPPPLPVLDGPIDLPVNRISLVVGDERTDFDLGAPDGSHKMATKGALLPAGASIATHRSRLESEAHARREAVLKQILPVIRRQFERQKKTTLARLGGEKARKGTRYWRPANGSAPVVTRQIKASDVFNADTWSEDWTGDLTPTMTDVFSAEGADAADEMDAAWDPENDEDLQAAIAAIVAKQVGNSALAIKTTQDRIDALIKAAEDGSWDQSTLTDEVGSYFDAPARQSEIATVLAVGAIAGAGLLAATIAGSAPADGGAGTPMQKSWVSMSDSRVRDSHAEADDGSWIAIDEAFSVGGEDLMYPADPSGSAEQVCGCRCILAFSPGPDTAQPDQSLEPDYSAFTEASAPHWLLERKAPPAPHWVLKRKEADAFVCELPPAPPRASFVLNLKAFDESLHPRDDRGRFGEGSDVAFHLASVDERVAQARDRATRQGGNPAQSERLERLLASRSTVYLAPNGARVAFDTKLHVTEAKQAQVLQAFTELNAKYGGSGIRTLNVSDVLKGVIGRAYGATVRNGSTIEMLSASVKPAGAKGFAEQVSRGAFSPTAKEAGVTRYTVFHEFGHTMDSPRGTPRNEATQQALDTLPATSTYGASDGHGDQAEKFAEAFAEYHLSGGATAEPLPQALAASEGWKA